MEDKMTLHNDKKLFTDVLLATAEYFSILPNYIEKDYWITYSLQLMSQSNEADRLVFKGGTSLSKAYRLVDRFSEDIDIAVIDSSSFTGNQLKTLIKKVAKEMTVGLQEIPLDGFTSKGSHFYKAVYAYPNILGQTPKSAVSSGNLLVEINTFANPYPFEAKQVKSFITDFLERTNNQHLISQYLIDPFSINVLDKRRTMIEKLVSLIRFSFSENPTTAIASKIRHFYDIYYLFNDMECQEYLKSDNFNNDFAELFKHDQKTFKEPGGWQNKTIATSVLLTDFNSQWNKIKETYRNELSQLAFTAIPDEKDVASAFLDTINFLHNTK
ncbi:nucleotidyl transferase AbiEii/AbiGii toxin family protein [Mangrovibacterium diazotrophicum]|uniref:Nucleotidyltransferase AbiEii toxin of type IV toxin-antitoxin system n=1 Tax=Mangrovibacterium diazotrophicum TaxID=1261403 RepID=A0A419WB17_9BACT|nr:nucleotidyl transferase AbiEii/AbiGii toxin family protein [Mangrovibacterium diazotrophicum]RKD92643.1 nucleotidyltransferase AbiEii toxin of type IV toxin-antitoxin system [Mangrovibacterium diazotrophicum]